MTPSEVARLIAKQAGYGIAWPGVDRPNHPGEYLLVSPVPWNDELDIRLYDESGLLQRFIANVREMDPSSLMGQANPREYGREAK